MSDPRTSKEQFSAVDVIAALERARGDDILKNRHQMLAVVLRLHRREYVMAQNEETGRYWSGPREDIPPRYSEVPDRAEGGPALEPSEQREGWFTFAQISYALNRSLFAKVGPLAIKMVIEDLWQALNNGGDYPRRQDGSAKRLPGPPPAVKDSLIAQPPSNPR